MVFLDHSITFCIILNKHKLLFPKVCTGLIPEGGGVGRGECTVGGAVLGKGRLKKQETNHEVFLPSC